MWRLKLFILGWKRRSATKLDEAGCPMWLIKWRCPPPVFPQWLFELLPRKDEGDGIQQEPKKTGGKCEHN